MRTNLVITCLLTLIMISCEKRAQDGLNSLITTQTEPVGENCTSGGLKVCTGMDINRNGVLEEEEIESIEYICNGEPGIDGLLTLMKILAEPPGVICQSGGYKIISGIDIDNNNELDENEILNEEYICNGNSGSDGISILMDIVAISAGENCQSGGFKIVSGFDTNNDSILEESEILNTEYICSMYLEDTRTGFYSDSVYQAESDGFLSVRLYNPTGGGGTTKGAFVYSDLQKFPTTIVGALAAFPSSILIPIQKDYYWRVNVNNPILTVSLSWIAIVN